MRAVVAGVVVLALVTGCSQEKSRRAPSAEQQNLSLPNVQRTIGLSAAADGEVELTGTRASRRGRGQFDDAWTAGNSLPGALAGMGAFVYDDALYLVGGAGADGGAITDVVSYPLQPDGTADFTAPAPMNALPKALLGAASVEAGGVVYVLGGFDSSTASVVSDASYAVIDSTGVLGAWTATSTLSPARENAAAVAWRGWVYLLGGDDGNGNDLADVVRAPVLPDGSLGGWLADATLPPPTGGTGGRTQVAAAVHGGKLYVVGGQSATGASADVAVADLRDDGSIGSFTALPSLPAGVVGAKLLAGAGNLFVLGGAASGPVYQAPLYADGSLGSWSPLLPLAGATAKFGAYFANGAAHVVGGVQGTANVASTANTPLLLAQPNATTPADGGSLVRGWQYNAYAEYDGYLYLIGGPGVANMTEVDVVPLNADGTPGTPSATTSVPTAVCGACATAYRGHLYVFGGSTIMSGNGTGCVASARTNNVYVAPINSDGTLGSFSTTSTLPANVEYCGAAADDGYVYLSSGDVVPGAVYSAKVESNGSLDPFVVARSAGSAFYYFRNSNVLIHRGRFFAMAVEPNNDPDTDIYSAALVGDGTLGPFMGTSRMSAAPSRINGNYGTQFVQIDDDIYATGGSPGGFNNPTIFGGEFTPDAGLYGGPGGFRTLWPFKLCHNYGAAVVHNGHMVGIGGLNGQDYLAESSDLRQTGVLGAWSSAGALPNTNATGRADTVAVAAAGELIVLGGQGSPGDPSSALSEIDVGHPVDGGQPSWSALSITLPEARFQHAAVVSGDTLFVAGGRDSSGVARSEVWATQIFPDGGLAGFAQVGDLGAGRARFGLAAERGSLVVVAGEDDGGTELDSSLVAPILANGQLGAFSSSTALGSFGARSGARALAYRGNVYLVGGERSGFTRSDVLMAPLQDGGLGAWTALDDLPAGRVGHALAKYGGHLYVVGGCESTAVPCPQATADVESAAFYADGTIGAWNELASLGATQQRSGVAAAVVGNTLYAIGGESGGTALTTGRRSVIVPPVATGSYEKRVDLGQLSTTASITLEPGGGDAARTGHFDLRVRSVVDDGGSGALFDLGAVAPGAVTPMPAELGPVQHLQLELTLDDTDDLVYGDASSSARDLRNLDIVFTPGTGPSSSSSSSSGSTGATGGSTASSTGSSGTSSGTSGATTGSSGTSGSGSSSVGSTSGSSGAGSAGGSSGSSGKVDVIGCACGPSSGSGGLAALALALFALVGLGRKRSAPLAVLLMVCAASLAHAEGHARRPRILVMQLGATYGIDPKISEVITNRLTAEIQQRTGAQVLSTADVQAQLGYVKTQAMLGCKDDQCLADIGGAVGADFMVTGSLARVGHSISFDAQVMNPAKCQVLRRYSDRIKGGSDDEFFDEADRAASALFPKDALPGTVLSVQSATATVQPAGPATSNAASSSTTPPVATQVAPAPSEEAGGGGGSWVVALGGASELTTKGGWGSLAVGRQFTRWAGLTVAGLFTGAKNAGVQLDADFTPLFQRAPVRPVIGVEVPVLFSDSVLVAVAPHLGVVWSPVDLLSFEVDVPVMFLANANADQRALYVMGQGAASVHF